MYNFALSIGVRKKILDALMHSMLTILYTMIKGKVYQMIHPKFFDVYIMQLNFIRKVYIYLQKCSTFILF